MSSTTTYPVNSNIVTDEEQCYECQYSFTAVLQGLNGCGKTSIFNRYLNDSFNKSSKPTYRAGFGVRFTRHMEKKVQLSLFDSPGTDNFVTVNPLVKAGQGADAYIIVFDITDSASFRKVRRLYQENLNF